MLFIDQPVGTGFSYASTVKGTMDLITRTFTPLANQDDDAVETNLTTVAGTISTPDPSLTVNTTAQAARTLWHFAQVWFQE